MATTNTGTAAPSRENVSSLTWKADPLGPRFEQAPLHLPDDAEATLVRYVPSTVVGADGVAERPVAVLYVHGFVDYFFHPHVAEALSAAGYAFYAVDLRGYGRSMPEWLAEGRKPNMVNDIAAYAADLDAAAEAVRARGHSKLVVMAHSMGGLVATLWQNGAIPAVDGVEAAPGAKTKSIRADALVLNAPWFDLNENALLRGPGTDAIRLLSKFAPELPVGGLKPYYGKSLHKDTGGEWDFDLTWKPHEGFPVQAAWLTSIRKGHKRLMDGAICLHVPVLVLASTRSGSAKQWHPEVLTTDSVLDVTDIAVGASKIGDDVTFIQIPGGAHDLALSREPARNEYLAAVIAWLKAKVPA